MSPSPTVQNAAAAAASSSAIPAFVIPIVKAYAGAMKSPVSFVMVGTVFGAMLVPLLIALFAFSTPQTRRTPVFVIVALQVVLGLVICVWNAHTMIHVILSPLDPAPPSASEGFTLTCVFAPWFIDLVLILRLLAVYPLATTPRATLLAVYAAPALLKLGRMAALVAFVVDWRRSVDGAEGYNISTVQMQRFAHSPAVKVEWAAQMFDNGYVTAVFLWKLRETFGSTTVRHSTVGGGDSVADRIRQLFWIATTNFVFPVVLNIVQLFTIFLCPFFISVQVAIVNIYLSIIGAVFCCVWSARSSRARELHSAGSGASYSQPHSPRALGFPLRSPLGKEFPVGDIPLRLVDEEASRHTAVEVHVKREEGYL